MEVINERINAERLRLNIKPAARYSELTNIRACSKSVPFARPASMTPSREAEFGGWPDIARVCRIADLHGREVASIARF
jgi:hypothetical protein